MLPYATGETVHFGSEHVDLGSRVVGLAATRESAAIALQDGRVVVLRAGAKRATAIDNTAVGRPASSADGGSFIWMSRAGKTTWVNVVAVSATSSAAVRTAALPADQDWTSHDATMGMTQRGLVVIDGPSGIWGWSPAEDSRITRVENVPHDTDLRAVLADEVTLSVGDLSLWGHLVQDGDRLTFVEKGRAAIPDLWFLPWGAIARDGTRLLEVASSVSVQPNAAGEVVPFHRLGDSRGPRALPQLAEVISVVHEEGTSFLVDAVDAEGTRGWARCSMKTPSCDLLVVLEPGDATPR